MIETLIEAQGLCRHFGPVHAVDGLDLRVSSGQIVGLVGPDGAGKTTTLRLLCGVLTPDGGRL
jgi:ABC-2 type transport system ATP-binding protein